jgi:hypothetical protein
MQSTSQPRSIVRLQVRKFSDQSAAERGEPFEVSEQRFLRAADGSLTPIDYPSDEASYADDHRGPQPPR